jgi:hypothetical protein
MKSFRKVHMTMERAGGYGHYFVRAFYKGKAVKVLTTDSELWDSFNDSDCKNHRDALRSAYNLIACNHGN